MGAALALVASATGPAAPNCTSACSRALCSYPGFRSPLLRAGVPLLLLGNALLFLLANVSVGARIELSLDLAQEAYSSDYLSHIPGVTNVLADALSRLLSRNLPLRHWRACSWLFCHAGGEGFWRLRAYMTPHER